MNETHEKPRPFLIRFFQRGYALIRGYFAIIGILVTFGPVLIMYVATRGGIEAPKFHYPEYSVDKPARLRLSLHGPLVEKEPAVMDQLYSRLFGGEQPIYLPDIRKALKIAAADARVARLEIEIGSLSGRTSSDVGGVSRKR